MFKVIACFCAGIMTNNAYESVKCVHKLFMNNTFSTVSICEKPVNKLSGRRTHFFLRSAFSTVSNYKKNMYIGLV